MASNNKRRETTRRQLEQRLQERQRREAARKRAVLIGSVTGTVVVIAVVLILVFVFTDNSDSNKPVAGSKSGCTVTHPKGSVVFDGVTVKNPTDLTKNPDVTSCSTAAPKTLEYKDLVVGKGAAATPTSTVKVQYAGVLYKNGTAFDSSWARGGKPVSFSLSGVVKGFTYGIGGSAGTVPPMKVGGRRVIVLPSTLGYGSQASGSIPANSSLVFVVDLTATSTPTSTSSSGTSTSPAASTSPGTSSSTSKSSATSAATS